MMKLGQKSESFDCAELDVFARLGWLSRVEEATRARMLEQVELRSYEEGEVLYRIGDEAFGIYGVVEGWIAVAVAADDGRETLIHAAGPGFWIGDLALLSRRRRQVAVTAVTPVRVCKVLGARVETMLQEDPGLYRDFYFLSSYNFGFALQTMGVDRVVPSKRRVALRLLALAEDCPQAQPWLPLKQEILAEVIGISVPSLGRSLTQLAEAGLIETGYGGIRLCDRAGLAQFGQS